MNKIGVECESFEYLELCKKIENRKKGIGEEIGLLKNF